PVGHHAGHDRVGDATDRIAHRTCAAFPRRRRHPRCDPRRGQRPLRQVPGLLVHERTSGARSEMSATAPVHSDLMADISDLAPDVLNSRDLADISDLAPDVRWVSRLT